jgi:hypothetical protein
LSISKEVSMPKVWASITRHGPSKKRHTWKSKPSLLSAPIETKMKQDHGWTLRTWTWEPSIVLSILFSPVN